MNTTTIQTTEAQAQYLEDMGEPSKKAALQQLIDHYKTEGPADAVDETQAREIAREVVTERVVPEAQQ